MGPTCITKRRWVALAAAGALAASMASGAAAATGKTFYDGTGDVAGAPDIGKVTISQDDDVLTVEADVANAPLLSPGTVVFALNTDNNPATGDLDGADYVLAADLKDLSGSVQRWNGKAYVNAKKVADPSRTLIGGKTVGFMFNLANFGWPKRIGLSMAVFRGAVSDGVLDRAPDKGAWTFDVRPAMDSLDLDFTPERPHAGAVFSYANQSAKLLLSDKTTVTPRTLSCTAHLAGAVLTGIGRSGACRWRIPAGTTGKLLTVDASVDYGGSEADFGTWKFRVG